LFGCDNFLSAGRYSAWNKKGELVGTAKRYSEGLLVFDTETERVIAQYRKQASD
jgi:hypothetical protein